MKHPWKITAILLAMFFVTQLIGLFVISNYAGQEEKIPYGLAPPKDIAPATSLLSIVVAIAFAVVLILILMRFKVELILRLWFFVVILLSIGITINSFILRTPLSSMPLDLLMFKVTAAAFIAFLIALPLAFLKVFRSSVIIHNVTELMIYPGIAAIFVPMLNIWTIVLLLIIISIYDAYAVWHAGFMQQMAKYQMNQVKVFAGFLVPNIGKKEREMIKEARSSKKVGKLKKIKVNLAILGGGDVVFPMILAGVIFMQMGLASALVIVAGATLALAYLFYISKKGKFYPAMPFITAGCFIALGLLYLVRYIF